MGVEPIVTMKHRMLVGAAIFFLAFYFWYPVTFKIFFKGGVAVFYRLLVIAIAGMASFAGLHAFYSAISGKHSGWGAADKNPDSFSSRMTATILGLIYFSVAVVGFVFSFGFIGYFS